jgi:hypothetical protein
MFILTVHWDLRLLWASLTVTAKFYIICLLGTAACTTYFLARTMYHLRRLQKESSIEAASVRRRQFEITRRIETLRQLHTLLFLLFGVVFANEMFATLRAIEYSSMSLSAARIDVFEPLTAFAFFAFVVLVFLQTFHWIVAARLQSFAAKLLTPSFKANDTGIIGNRPTTPL